MSDWLQVIFVNQCHSCDLGSQSPKGHPTHFPKPIYSFSHASKAEPKRYYSEKQKPLRQRTQAENIKVAPDRSDLISKNDLTSVLPCSFNFCGIFPIQNCDFFCIRSYHAMSSRTSVLCCMWICIKLQLYVEIGTSHCNIQTPTVW